MPIQRGASVKWTAPGGGLRTFAGEVVCHVPARSLLSEASRPHMQGLAWVAMCADLRASRVHERAFVDRYLIRTPEEHGNPRRYVYRVALAGVLDKQNPDAPREPQVSTAQAMVGLPPGER